MIFVSPYNIFTYFLSNEAGGLSNSRRDEGDKPNRIPLESGLFPYDLLKSAHSSGLRTMPFGLERSGVPNDIL